MNDYIERKVDIHTDCRPLTGQQREDLKAELKSWLLLEHLSDEHLEPYIDNIQNVLEKTTKKEIK